MKGPIDAATRKRKQRKRLENKGFKRFEDYAHPDDLPPLRRRIKKLREKRVASVDTVTGHD